MFTVTVGVSGLLNTFLGQLRVRRVRVKMRQNAEEGGQTGFRALSYESRSGVVPALAAAYLTARAINKNAILGMSDPDAVALVIATIAVAMVYLYGWLKSKDSAREIANVYVWGLFRLTVLFSIEAFSAILFLG